MFLYLRALSATWVLELRWQTTASALANAWHRVVDFKPKTKRFTIGTFGDDMISTPEQAFKINVF